MLLPIRFGLGLGLGFKSYSIDDMLLLYGSTENKLDENGNFNLVLEKLEQYKNIDLFDKIEPIIMFDN